MPTEVETQDPFERIYGGLQTILENCRVPEENIDAYLKYMFDESPVLSDEAAQASEVINRAFLTSLGRIAVNIPEYSFSEQSVIGLIVGRDFEDKPRTISEAVEEFANAYGGTELLVEFALRNVVTGIEKFADRSAQIGFRPKLNENMHKLPKIKQRRHKRLKTTRPKSKA